MVRAAGLAVFAIALGACATPPEDPVARQAFEAQNDPLEPFNRYMFDINMALDDLVINPLATMYVEGIPEPYRNGVRNFLQNLRMPITILNSALQGDGENTVDSAVSFFINTTAGLGGIFDIPGNFDKEPRREDFGQTLGVWGMGEGPYLVLPLVGPSGVRDGIGLGVDIATDPTTYVFSGAFSYVTTGAAAIQFRSDTKAEYDSLRRTSVDFYATLRSLYRQIRERQIANDEAGASSLDYELDTYENVGDDESIVE
jgi:phospholipid-binding lipoprotein MlaA